MYSVPVPPLPPHSTHMLCHLFRTSRWIEIDTSCCLRSACTCAHGLPSHVALQPLWPNAVRDIYIYIYIYIYVLGMCFVVCVDCVKFMMCLHVYILLLWLLYVYQVVFILHVCSYCLCECCVLYMRFVYGSWDDCNFY